MNRGHKTFLVLGGIAVVVLLAKGAIYWLWGVRSVPYGVDRIKCKRVIVLFTSTATTDMVQNAADKVGGHIVDDIPQLNTYTFSLPDRCRTDTVLQAIETLDGQPGVMSAESILYGSLQ